MKNTATLFALILLSITFAPAGAMPIVNVAPCVYTNTVPSDGLKTQCVDSIDSLELGGNFFDVDFVSGIFGDVFPGSPPSASFWGDETGARAAADAIVAALGTRSYPLGPEAAPEDERYGIFSDCFYDADFNGDGFGIRDITSCSGVPSIPWGFTPAGGGSTVLFSVGILSATGISADDLDRPNSRSQELWAVFTPAATIPEPTTLALMALGLAGVGFSQRKTR